MANLGGVGHAAFGHQRDDLEWRSALWIAPWLGGLAVISWLGQFDGRDVIPFWLDLVVLVAFSLVIYELAIRGVLSTEKVRRFIEIEALEDAAEPDLHVA